MKANIVVPDKGTTYSLTSKNGEPVIVAGELTLRFQTPGTLAAPLGAGDKMHKQLAEEANKRTTR